MAERGQHGVAVVQHPVRRGVLFAVAAGPTPPDGRKVKLPVFPGAVSFVHFFGFQGTFQIGGKLLVLLQDALLVPGLAQQEPIPNLLIEPGGAADLVLEGAQINDAGQWRGDAAGLILLVAVQNDDFSLQQRSDRIGGEGNSTGCDDHCSNVFYRHPSFRQASFRRRAAGQKTTILAKDSAMLENMQDVIRHSAD